MGIDALLPRSFIEPQLVELAMDKVLECNMGIVRTAIGLGAAGIVLGDDYACDAGPLMSPGVFEHFVLPRLAGIDMVYEEGALCIKHTDGDMCPLPDMSVWAAPDGINAIEPVGGMQVRRVKQLVGHQLSITGSIDCAHLPPYGTKKEARAAVRQAIADAAEGGRAILTSSNSIHSSCRPENIVAMGKACRQDGEHQREGAHAPSSTADHPKLKYLGVARAGGRSESWITDASSHAWT